MSAHRARDPEYATRDSWGRNPRFSLGSTKTKRLRKKAEGVWPGPGWRKILRRRYPMMPNYRARLRRWGFDLLKRGETGRVYNVVMVEDSALTRAVERNAQVGVVTR